MKEFYNKDCMEGMKEYPDNYFDLAIVDPPYGGAGIDTTIHGAEDGRFGNKGSRFEKYREIGTHFHGRGRSKKYADIQCSRTGVGWANKLDPDRKINRWDNAPSQEYFDELFRISKNQIIWGGNYFQLPITRCFLVWRKLTISENFTMAMAEYAWTSFNDNAKVFEHAPQDKERFHPTQKPVALYKWILSHYAKQGDLILDTHVGSASSLIACEELGFDYVGYEINETYYELAKQRLDDFNAQIRMF